jgi:hypothetical protein
MCDWEGKFGKVGMFGFVDWRNFWAGQSLNVWIWVCCGVCPLVFMEVWLIVYLTACLKICQSLMVPSTVVFPAYNTWLPECLSPAIKDRSTNQSPHFLTTHRSPNHISLSRSQRPFSHSLIHPLHPTKQRTQVTHHRHHLFIFFVVSKAFIILLLAIKNYFGKVNFTLYFKRGSN